MKLSKTCIEDVLDDFDFDLLRSIIILKDGDYPDIKMLRSKAKKLLKGLNWDSKTKSGVTGFRQGYFDVRLGIDEGEPFDVVLSGNLISGSALAIMDGK